MTNENYNARREKQAEDTRTFGRAAKDGLVGLAAGAGGGLTLMSILIGIAGMAGGSFGPEQDAYVGGLLAAGAGLGGLIGALVGATGAYKEMYQIR